MEVEDLDLPAVAAAGEAGGSLSRGSAGRAGVATRGRTWWVSWLRRSGWCQGRSYGFVFDLSVRHEALSVRMEVW